MQTVSTIENFSEMLKAEEQNELAVALRKVQATVDAQKVRTAYENLRLTARDAGWV